MQGRDRQYSERCKRRYPLKPEANRDRIAESTGIKKRTRHTVSAVDFSPDARYLLVAMKAACLRRAPNFGAGQRAPLRLHPPDADGARLFFCTKSIAICDDDNRQRTL